MCKCINRINKYINGPFAPSRTSRPSRRRRRALSVRHSRPVIVVRPLCVRPVVRPAVAIVRPMSVRAVRPVVAVVVCPVVVRPLSVSLSILFMSVPWSVRRELLLT